MAIVRIAENHHPDEAVQARAEKAVHSDEAVQVGVEKAAIRKEIKLRRLSMSADEEQFWNEQLFARLFVMPELLSVQIVYSYVSCNKEPDTRRLLEYLWQRGVTTAVPKVFGAGRMEFYIIRSFADLEPGMMGILEPRGHCQKVDELQVAKTGCWAAGQPDLKIDNSGARQPDLKIDGSGARQPDLKINDSGAWQPDLKIDDSFARQPDLKTDGSSARQSSVQIQATSAQAVVITPGLAFDRRGNRVGYGGGYYDRFFEQNPRLLRIGLAFGFQLYERVPAEDLDQQLDGLIVSGELGESGERIGHFYEFNRNR